MDNKIKTFIQLADLFNKNHFSLYLVGGSVRDYLLNIPLTDMDVVTDATPKDMREFLKSADYTFEKYGSVKVVFRDIKFDITTLRKESSYLDSRHPNKIEFTNKLEEDVIRRDITINALYLDKDLKVIDLVNGQKDLDNKVIRLIGDPNIRIKEDPLRIIRILRFKLELGFDVEEKTHQALRNNKRELDKLNKDKINQEIKKSHHIELLKREIENL